MYARPMRGPVDAQGLGGLGGLKADDVLQDQGRPIGLIECTHDFDQRLECVHLIQCGLVGGAGLRPGSAFLAVHSPSQCPALFPGDVACDPRQPRFTGLSRPLWVQDTAPSILRCVLRVVLVAEHGARETLHSLCGKQQVSGGVRIEVHLFKVVATERATVAVDRGFGGAER